MPPIPSNIGSLGATPYVDAFTTGEIIGFVVLIICTQIVITWIAVRSIKSYMQGNTERLIGLSSAHFGYLNTKVDKIEDRLRGVAM